MSGSPLTLFERLRVRAEEAERRADKAEKRLAALVHVAIGYQVQGFGASWRRRGKVHPGNDDSGGAGRPERSLEIAERWAVGPDWYNTTYGDMKAAMATFMAARGFKPPQCPRPGFPAE